MLDNLNAASHDLINTVCSWDTMAEIQLATVLPGATAFNAGNVNDTFHGQILLTDGAVKSAVIKDLDQRQLANELCAFALANEAGLPIPTAYLAVVRGSDLAITKGPRLRDGNGLVFASENVKVPNITFQLRNADAHARAQLLSDLVQWDDLGRLYAFDAWIANVDRHRGNLLFGGKDEIWLIDHGHCFSGPAWQPSDLDANAAYRHRLSEWLTTLLSLDQKRQRSREAAAFAGTLQGIDISQASTDSHIRHLIPSDHVDALERFLGDRGSKIPEHSNRALGVPSLV